MSHQISRGLVSTINSTTIPLAAGASFVGLAEDVSQYRSIAVSVDTDQEGLLFMEISSDGINWDRRKTSPIKQSITSGSLHNFPVICQFFRAIFFNGTTNQGHIRLQTIYHTSVNGVLTASPDQVISSMFDAQLVRNASDVMLDLSRNLYSEKFVFTISGNNGDVGNASFEDIWSYGPTQALIARPLASEKFRVKAGGDANDDVAGTGARAVQLAFLDDSGDLTTETLTLSGVAASAPTTVTGRRVLLGNVTATGTAGGTNIADIVIENEISSEIVAVISAGKGQTQMSHTTTPAGFRGYIRSTHVNVAVGNNKDADVNFCTMDNAYATAAPFGAKRIVKSWLGLQSPDPISPDVFRQIEPLTDVWAQAKGAGASTAVSFDYDIIMIREDVIPILLTS